LAFLSVSTITLLSNAGVELVVVVVAVAIFSIYILCEIEERRKNGSGNSYLYPKKKKKKKKKKKPRLSITKNIVNASRFLIYKSKTQGFIPTNIERTGTLLFVSL
jgi:hypothetical protein